MGDLLVRHTVIVMFMFSSLGIDAQNTCTASPTHVPPGGVSTLTCACKGDLSWHLENGGRIIGKGPKVEYDTHDVDVISAVIDAYCAGKLIRPPLVLDIDLDPLQSAKSLPSIPLKQTDGSPFNIKEFEATLDDVALILQRDANTKIIALGMYVAGVPGSASRAASATVSVKQDLIKRKGISSSRIELRVQEGDVNRVEMYLIYQGYGMRRSTTHPVDELTRTPILR
jgi:hypothetical protein